MANIWMPLANSQTDVWDPSEVKHSVTVPPVNAGLNIDVIIITQMLKADYMSMNSRI